MIKQEFKDMIKGAIIAGWAHAEVHTTMSGKRYTVCNELATREECAYACKMIYHARRAKNGSK